LPAGVVLTLAVPVVLLLLAGWLLGEIFSGLVFLLSILIFIYSLGPNLNTLLHHYLESLQGNLQEDIAVIETRLGLDEETGDRDFDNHISAVLLRSHDYLFGVIFWYIILGMAGALLYSLVRALKERFDDIHGAYAEAVRDLERILKWPSARLMAIGIALADSPVDAVAGRRAVSGDTLNNSDSIIAKSGLGALQYQGRPVGDEGRDRDRYAALIGEVKALVNRTLIVWLTVLGLLTIGGFVA